MKSYGHSTVYLGNKRRNSPKEARYSTHQSTSRKALVIVERERASRSLKAAQQKLYAQLYREAMGQPEALHIQQ